MVAAASPLKTAKDFNGKTIAVNTLHSVDQIAMDAWTDQNGGDSKTLKFLEVPNITMVDAAALGRVDGAIIADPGYTAGLEGGKVRHLANVNTGVAKRFMVSAWFSSRAWADHNPDAIRKFAAAINDGATWAVKNPQPAALLLQKYMRLTVSSAHEHHGFTLDPALLQPLIDASARYGVLKSPLDVHDIIWRYPGT
jgi:NitT/TauT family transport system substrate-binding protein